MYMRLFIVALFMSACSTAGLEFRGLPATTVTVDGSTFDVRVGDGRAEAIRTNSEYAPRFGPIRARAGKAMALVSGCEVKKVLGDQAQAIGILKCGKGTRHVPMQPLVLDCVPVRGTEVAELGGTRIEISCDRAL